MESVGWEGGAEEVGCGGGEVGHLIKERTLRTKLSSQE